MLALRWAAHYGALLGARLEVVMAWEYPPSFGWAAVAPDWRLADDAQKEYAWMPRPGQASDA